MEISFFNVRFVDIFRIGGEVKADDMCFLNPSSKSRAGLRKPQLPPQIAI